MDSCMDTLSETRIFPSHIGFEDGKKVGSTFSVSIDKLVLIGQLKR